MLVDVDRIDITDDTIKEIDINPPILAGSRSIVVDALVVLQPIP